MGYRDGEPGTWVARRPDAAAHRAGRREPDHDARSHVSVSQRPISPPSNPPLSNSSCPDDVEPDDVEPDPVPSAGGGPVRTRKGVEASTELLNARYVDARPCLKLGEPLSSTRLPVDRWDLQPDHGYRPRQVSESPLGADAGHRPDGLDLVRPDRALHQEDPSSSVHRDRRRLPQFELDDDKRPKIQVPESEPWRSGHRMASRTRSTRRNPTLVGPNSNPGGSVSPSSQLAGQISGRVHRGGSYWDNHVGPGVPSGAPGLRWVGPRLTLDAVHQDRAELVLYHTVGLHRASSARLVSRSAGDGPVGHEAPGGGEVGGTGGFVDFAEISLVGLAVVVPA
jgi:hypothetical protein